MHIELRYNDSPAVRRDDQTAPHPYRLLGLGIFPSETRILLPGGQCLDDPMIEADMMCC